MKVFAVNSDWHIASMPVQVVARGAKLHIAQDVINLARHFLCGYIQKTLSLS